MEPKKNPKYDVHQKRGILLNVGLIVSLILVITAFKWAVPFKYSPISLTNENDLADPLLFENPHVTSFEKKELPKPKPLKTFAAITPNITEVKSAGPEPDPSPEIDLENKSDMQIGIGDIPEEIAELDTFRVVEKMPEPVGGWQTFYNILSKNLKYPPQARRKEASGRVFIEFTVNNKGELSHFKILKGIGYGCDEEAKRVIALTKWNPGKQRGRAVNVRMVQPIGFTLK
jgi:protein TonB